MKKTIISVATMFLSVCLYTEVSDAAIHNQTSTGHVTFSPGALSLDAVPNFDFGQQDITAVDKTYHANSEVVVTVTDLRGSSVGWNLTVKQDGQLKTAQNEELVGAELSLANGVIETNSVDTANISNGKLIPGGAALKVLDASAGQGNGSFSAKWGTSGVTLEVPGASTKLAKSYTANLTWTLTDAPA